MSKKEIFLIVFLFAFIWAWSYLVCAFGVWLLSFAFSFKFTWLKAFIVWVIFNLLFGGLKVSANRS